MSLIAYLDEQYGTMNGEDFTAVVGFVLPFSQIDSLRESFYPAFNNLLNSLLSGAARHENRIRVVAPVLHGSAFFLDHSDDFKFSVLDLLFASFDSLDAKFIRIGYFHNSLPNTEKSSAKQMATQMALTSVLFALSASSDPFQIVFEFDKEELKRQIRSSGDGMCGLYCAGEKNTEVAYRQFIGHFFAPKTDLGCQVADVTGYAALKRLTSNSEFGQRFGRYSDKLSDRYLLNEIIWCNDPTRSLCFPQEYDRPLRGWFNITPTDS